MEVRHIQDVPPSAEEVQRAVNRLESHYVRQMESVGGFGGRADLLNYFNVMAGDPGRLNTDFDRYLTVTAEDVQRVARQYMGAGRVRLVVRPKPETSITQTNVDRTQQPLPAATPSFHAPVPERLKLSNGLDLLVVERHEVPTVALAAYILGGAVFDPAGRPGLLSFTGRLLQEGTKTRSSVQIAEESEFIASRPSLGTGREEIVASAEALTKHWPKALELLADI